MHRTTVFLFLLLVVQACNSNPASEPPPPPPPPEDPVVAGVNLDTLFASPTGQERATVQSEWASRSTTYEFDHVASTEDDDGAELEVFAVRRIATTEVLFYGMYRLPIRKPGDVAPRPLVLVLPDGDGNASDFALRPGALPITPAEHEDYIFVTVAYRGQQLAAGDLEFSSQAEPQAYDFDTDDALAFLDYVRGYEILVNQNSTGVIGVGRGGTVALLAASRDYPFDLVVDIAGPTDFIGPIFRSTARSILQGNSGGNFPAISEIAENILYPLRDEEITMEEARHELLLRSPRHFVSPPPFIFVTHGQLDFTVSVEHSRALDTIGGTTEALYLEVENTDHINILQNFEVISRTTAFLQEHLDGP
ncbi:MAG: hypothetical protein R3284_06845 [Rubricoccaceae bacterium]|nr:hypothetical protein [Rubricoccaceae bacterium]